MPGVPKAMYLPLVFLIELVANPHHPAAQHGGPTLRQHDRRPPAARDLRRPQPGAVRVRPTSASSPSFGLLVFLSAFEVLVAFLQAYIFTILAAVYIGGAMHPEH